MEEQEIGFYQNKFKEYQMKYLYSDVYCPYCDKTIKMYGFYKHIQNGKRHKKKVLEAGDTLIKDVDEYNRELMKLKCRRRYKDN
jgi:hypothetical protein